MPLTVCRSGAHAGLGPAPQFIDGRLGVFIFETWGATLPRCQIKEKPVVWAFLFAKLC